MTKKNSDRGTTLDTFLNEEGNASPYAGRGAEVCCKSSSASWSPARCVLMSALVVTPAGRDLFKSLADVGENGGCAR
jgi:hypothetical protein